jgi:hypothetical protein
MRIALYVIEAERFILQSPVVSNLETNLLFGFGNYNIGVAWGGWRRPLFFFITEFLRNF